MTADREIAATASPKKLRKGETKKAPEKAPAPHELAETQVLQPAASAGGKEEIQDPREESKEGTGKQTLKKAEQRSQTVPATSNNLSPRRKTGLTPESFVGVRRQA